MDEKKGWKIEGKTATFHGGKKEKTFSCGKCIGYHWSYTATVVLTSEGLDISVEDDDDTSGQAHGGSYTDLTIPTRILNALLKAK